MPCATLVICTNQSGRVQPLLRLSPRCVHLKRHGGLKAAVRELQQRLPGYRFVLRTDVASGQNEKAR